MPSSLVETLWTIIQRLQVRLNCAAAHLQRWYVLQQRADG